MIKKQTERQALRNTLPRDKILPFSLLLVRKKKKVKDDPSKVKVAGHDQCPYLPWTQKLRLKT